MKRRQALKNIGLFSSGMLLFSSCDFSDEKVSIILNKLRINADQELLLKEIIGSMLPEGEIPGGISLKVHNFVWVMIDDCSSKEQQYAFLQGLTQFDTEVQKASNKSFIKLSQKDKLSTLSKFIKGKKENSNIVNFLSTTKKIAISGYMNSEYIMTEQMPYKLVPGAGSYVTCKTINPSEKINING